MNGTGGAPHAGASKVWPEGCYPARPNLSHCHTSRWPHPTLDIFLRNRLSVAGAPSTLFADISSRPLAEIELSAPCEGGVFEIICRYIAGEWLTALERIRDRLAGVAYCTDEDRAAMLPDPTLPIRYRFRIWRRCGSRLSALAGELWVATPALAEKYRRHGAKLLPSLYVPGPSGMERPVRYCYHGTAAHGPELRWLVDIVAEVQRRNYNAVFETIGQRDVCAMFRGIDCVVVTHPVDWPAYLAHSARARRDIGLATLFTSSVKAARVRTRVFDIARACAAGIYSNWPPYAGYVRNGEDGLLLGDDRAEWVETSLDLAAHVGRRSAMVRAARLRCRQCDDALLQLLGLDDGSKVVAAEAGRERSA